VEFEWQDAKADLNLLAHGVSVEWARTAFRDPVAIEFLDGRQNYGEERFPLIGMADGQQLLFIAFTERNGRIRIISARRATRREQDLYFRENASTDEPG
jgi:uncharacterized DUF497 family protein